VRNYKDHLIFAGSTIKNALVHLNELSNDAILFVIDTQGRLIGALTDGDVRRGLINGFTIESPVDDIIQSNPRYITKGLYDLKNIIEYRENKFKIIPVLDENHRVVNVVNFRNIKSYLPVDAVVMAGGRGQRLRPLTDGTPKPLLKVGSKSIMEHNIDRLILYGIDDFWFCVKYLGEQIQDYFGKGEKRNIKITYVWENEVLGTIGAVSKIDNFKHNYVLVTNSDLLTNIDYEHFFLEFLKKDVDLAVITIPYQVNVPYAVLETAEDDKVLSLREKPKYTYYSNGGIYLMKREVIKYIPKDTFYNATDLMQDLIKNGLKVASYPFSGYWMDIGRHEDFIKAQSDIQIINF
jgi:dTDP-glucose pyrophosphorylase